MKIFVLFLAIAFSLSARAANVDIETIPDLPLNNIPPISSTETKPPAGVWKFSLGGGASYAPRYEGAANNRLRFMPLVDASYKDGHFFMSLLRGVGYNFSESRNVQYGVRLSPGHGRRESADPHLHGMGNIGFTPEAGLFFNQRFAPWYISGGISSGSHGTHAELGGGIGFPLSVADRLRLGVNLNWGNAKYNQTYFGVTAAQAAASGNVINTYDSSAGIKDYAMTANWLRNYDKDWFSNAGLSYKWLAGPAKQSPLTQRSSMGSVNFLVGYRF
jgi:outer membrane scaffolding protein for murein synthesis (MipA/OmpV family)